MILKGEILDQLEDWLVKTLEPISQADPSVLSTYVMALLRIEKPRQELVGLCEEQLEDFLQEESVSFVAALFEKLDQLLDNTPYGSTLMDPGLPPSDLSSPSPSPNNTPRELSPADRSGAWPPPSVDQPLPPLQHQLQGLPYGGGGPGSKRRRRGESAETSGSRDSRKSSPPAGRVYGAPMRPAAASAAGRSGWSSRMRPDVEASAPGVRVPGGWMGRQHDAESVGAVRVAGGNPCPEFLEMGYCMRGDRCTLDHGQDPIVVPWTQQYAPPHVAQHPNYQRNVPANRPYGELAGETYHNLPYRRKGEKAVTALSRRGGGAPTPWMPPQVPADKDTFHRSRVDVTHPPPVRRGEEPPRLDGWTASVDADVKEDRSTVSMPHKSIAERAPDALPSKSQPPGQSKNQPGTGEPPRTLLISAVPRERCSIGPLNGHFRKFGTITGIQIMPEEMKALIRYATHKEARMCVGSSEAVFGNRFVKVEWACREPPYLFDADDIDESKLAKRNPRPIPDSSSLPCHPERRADGTEIANVSATAASEPLDLSQEKTMPSEKPAAEILHLSSGEKAPSSSEIPGENQRRKRSLKELQSEKLGLAQKQLQQYKAILESLSQRKNMDPKERSQIVNRISKAYETIHASIKSAKLSQGGKQQED